MMLLHQRSFSFDCIRENIIKTFKRDMTEKSDSFYVKKKKYDRN